MSCTISVEEYKLPLKLNYNAIIKIYATSRQKLRTVADSKLQLHLQALDATGALFSMDRSACYV
jgi:hypothetical protein